MRLKGKHLSVAIIGSLMTHLCAAALFGSQILEQKISEEQELLVSRISLVADETLEQKLPTKTVSTPRIPSTSSTPDIHKRITAKPQIKQQKTPKRQQNHLSLGIKKTQRNNSEDLQTAENLQNNAHGIAQQEQARVNYEQLLVAWIDKHKRYPEKALKRGFQGQAELRMQIGRDGELLNFQLHRSSGLTVFDQEVLALAKRAAPYPKPNQGVSKLDFIVPIQFRLR